MRFRITIKHIVLLLFFIVSSPFTFAQNASQKEGTIKGVIANADNHEAIELGTIKILNPKDSTLISGISASDTGGFHLSSKLGEYLLEASMLGYEKEYRNIKLTQNNPSVNLDTIFLKPNDIFLKEIQVTAEIPAMQVKGDTIEFNAGAYNIDGSTVLSDLIKQIPGLELDEKGGLKANGKVITKILVDGKEFFGNDISKALTSLPANMINKLQLFEKESEEAKASGIKDVEPEQVLNLDVKEEFKKSIFGDTKSGIGNKGRHVNRANLTKMHGDNQYSLIGNINNINDFGGYGVLLGGNYDDNISKDIGANFNIQQSEKVSINGNASYNNNKSVNESSSESYSSMLDQYSERSNTGINRRQNMNISASIDWKPDSLTTIILRTGFSYNDGSNINNSTDSASIGNINNTKTTTNNISDNKGFNTNNSLMISRRLNNKGRNISVTLDQGYNNSTSDGLNYSERIYSEENKLDIIDQKSNRENKGTNYRFFIRYVEPLGKDSRLYASYSINSSKSENLADVRKKDPLSEEYDIIDPEYFKGSDSYSFRQKIALGFQHSKEKYDFNIDFSMDPSYTRNTSFQLNSLPEDLKQNVINYSPSARLSWKPNKNTRLGFSYRGSTNHPSVNQLSSVVIVHNAMSKSVGNPNLKPSFSNDFGIDFRKSDFESGRFFSASINYSYLFNNVVSYRTVDKHSNTLSTYRNVDGNSNASLFLTYNTPLRNKKFNLGGHFYTNYSRSINFLNEKKQIIDRLSLSPTFYGRFNSPKFETRLDFGISHTIAENNTSEKKQSNDTDYRLSHNMTLKLPFDFSFESDLRFSYRSGLSANAKKDETMWNLSASKRFLKDKRGTLRLEFYDVLNDFRNQRSVVNGSDYSNSWQRVVNNYFIFSFSYRFNIPGNKG